MTENDDPPIDFALASLTWRTKSGIVGRWRLVAAARPTREGAAGQVVLAHMVMAGDVFGRGRLLREPAYSFQIFASTRRHVIIREYGVAAAGADSMAENAETFHSLRIDAPRLTSARSVDLGSPQAESLPWPLTARIRAIGRAGEAWLLEFPIAHINHRVTSGKAEFQAETGPVLIPDALLPVSDPSPLGGFELAYLFFDRLDRVDLALFRQVWSGRQSARHFARFARVEAALVEVYSAVRQVAPMP